MGDMNTPMNWLEPLPFAEDTRCGRHTYVSQDPRYTVPGLSAAEGDAERTEAPNWIPPWVLPMEETISSSRKATALRRTSFMSEACQPLPTRTKAT